MIAPSVNNVNSAFTALLTSNVEQLQQSTRFLPPPSPFLYSNSLKNWRSRARSFVTPTWIGGIFLSSASVLSALFNCPVHLSFSCEWEYKPLSSGSSLQVGKTIYFCTYGFFLRRHSYWTSIKYLDSNWHFNREFFFIFIFNNMIISKDLLLLGQQFLNFRRQNSNTENPDQ